MRISKCTQAGRQIANLKTIVHTQLSERIVYELGEVIYSGPPINRKDRLGNNVNGTSVHVTSTAGCKTEEPAQWTNEDGKQDSFHEEDPLKVTLVPSLEENCEVPPVFGDVLFLREVPRENGEEDLSEREEVDPLTLEDTSRESVVTVSLLGNNAKVVNGKSNSTNLNGDATPSDDDLIHKNRPCASAADFELEEPSKEMVRLIQEPKSKVDPHCLRRCVRAPKRLGSVDSVDSNSGSKCDSSTIKQCEKELRNRRISCLSDPSDSEASELLGNVASVEDSAHIEIDKLSKCRKPKNGETPIELYHLCSNAGKVNGEVVNCTVNGLNNNLKARRVSRTNSDDSDSASTPKTNGIDTDNDKVDINLLLEISAKDRKRFENKKAKIKRKCADWMLITETEQYYNEKEEILRNKNREDSDSDSESFVSCKESKPEKKKPSEESNLESNADKEKGKNVKKNIPVKLNSGTSKVKKAVHKGKSELGEDLGPTKGSRGRSKGSRNLSFWEHGSVSFETNTRAAKSKGMHFLDKQKEKDLKPRKRLSDAERFLRDNREYYQFPETRDRLRRNISYGTKELDDIPQEDEGTSNEQELREVQEEVIPENSQTQSKKIADSTSQCNETKFPLTRTQKNKRSKRTTRNAKCKTYADLHSATDSPLIESLSSKSVAPISDHVKEVDDENETLGRLYFSFEGAPVQETWYQTYQRYIDGVRSEEFIYEQDPLRFILPYEMPKEYFRDLNAKRSLLARRKSELAELVRKSPRCHASTLALFSNLFPGKKKKARVSKVGVKTEENSSDGTNTPVYEAAKLPPLSDILETDDELLFLGQCMEQIMKSTVEENLSFFKETNEQTLSRKDTRKSTSKRRAKVKKATVLKPSKIEIPSELKEFDNPLACEVDSHFLSGLPNYLEEMHLLPEDTLCKNAEDILSDSCNCGCTERTSCDETSSVDERTEISSESVSVCDSETVGSFNNNFSAKVRKFGPHKKRRKNLTGWPTQKRRRPAAAATQASDDNDSVSMEFDDSTSSSSRFKGRPRLKQQPFQLLKTDSDLSIDSLGRDRRASPRKRSSVLYMDTWPVRFRYNK